jgi:hypothetical protein
MRLTEQLTHVVSAFSKLGSHLIFAIGVLPFSEALLVPFNLLLRRNWVVLVMLSPN